MSTKTSQILLVEGNEAHIELIRRALETEDKKFNLTVAGSLAEARKILKKATPDLMIVDYLLPDGKGLELLPSNSNKQTSPVAIMTGHGDEKIATAAIKAGAIDYIVKCDKTLADMPHVIESILREWMHITKRKQADKFLKQRERQQAVISELSLDSMKGLELDALLQKTTDILAETLDVEYCKVLELQPNGKALLLRTGAGWKEGLVGYATVDTGIESQAGYTLKSNHPVIVTDLRTETRFSGPPLLHDHGVVSGISVIIKVAEQPWGILGVHTKKHRNFNENDINFIQTVANVLALSIGGKQSEMAFQTIIKSIVWTTGQSFFENAVNSLCKWLDAECAIISEITHEGHVQALGMQLDGKNVDQFEYDLPGSPCGNVVTNSYCTYPEKVQELFPKDRDLVELQAEGYVGISLRDRNAKPVGVLCVLSRHKLTLPPKTREVFEIIAAKAAAEIKRKQSEDELSHKKSQYESLYSMLRMMCDNMPDMVWAKDLDKHYIFANKALCNNLLHAKDTDEPVGKMDMFFAERERNMHPEDPEWHTFGEICRDSDAITLKGGKSEQFDEFGNVRHQFLFLDVHKAPMFDENGKVVGVVGSARDVTEARKTEEKYRQLVEFSPDPIGMHCSGKWVYVNPAGIKLFGGKNAEDFIGKSVLDFVHPDFRNAVIKRGRKETEKGKASPLLEEKLLRLDGQSFDAEVISLPIDFENKRAAIVIARDITERKLVEKSLQEEQAQSRQIIDTARDAFVSMDKNGIITDWNPCAEALFGWNREESIGRLMSETIIPEKLRESHTMGLAHYLATGKGSVLNQHVEITALHRDGHTIPVELSIVSAHSNDTMSFNAFIRDISGRVQAREELEKSRQQLKTSLIGTVVAVSRAVGARDPYTAGHQQRVSQLSRAIAQEMKLDGELIEGLRLGATIHDIGKIYLPAEILSKPAKLTDVEYALVKSHAEVGYGILKDIAFPWPVADIAHQHHERLDGSGYPQGLKGDEICLEARIVAVADVVEAMSSHRPYRAALGFDAALQEIETHRGKWFDPAAVDACLTLCREKDFTFE